MRINVVALIVLVGVSACLAVNIVEKAEELGATTLLSLLVSAELNGTLSGAGPFTVFAPTNEAFAALPQELLDELAQNKTLLQSVLKYHVVSGDVRSSALSNDMVAASLEGPAIRFNIYGQTVLATGCQVTLADQVADNGVIHVVSKVLMAPTADVVDFAIADSRFSTLVTALQTAELVSAVRAGNLTVFAPTNDAFDAVPNLDEILADKALLTSILTYHVVSGTVYSAGLSDGMEVTTLQGEDLEVSISGGNVMINEATVIIADVSVTNGVIHALDKVLVPEVDPSSAHTLSASIITLTLASLLAIYRY